MKAMTSMQGLLRPVNTKEGRLRRNKCEVLLPDVRTFAVRTRRNRCLNYNKNNKALCKRRKGRAAESSFRQVGGQKQGGYAQFRMVGNRSAFGRFACKEL